MNYVANRYIAVMIFCTNLFPVWTMHCGQKTHTIKPWSAICLWRPRHAVRKQGCASKHFTTKQPNREYLAPKIRSMNNRFHSEAKLPWSYDYPLANHITTYKSSTYREMPLFSRLYPPFGYLRKIFPPRGLKFSLLLQWRDISYMQCFYVYIYNYGESGFALKQNV